MPDWGAKAPWVPLGSRTAVSSSSTSSTGGGGVTTLAALTDVDTTGVADNDSLTYDQASGKWVPEARQPLDSDLTAIAALSPSNDDVLQRKAGSWVNRTIAQLKTDLAIMVADISDFASSVASAITTERTAVATYTNKDLTAGTNTFPTFNQNTTGSAATLTTSRTIGTLTGDVTSAGSGFNGSANNSNAATLATVNSNVGSFGSASSVATFTVNGKGLTTAAGSTSIQIAESQVTNLVTDLAAKQPLDSDLTAIAALSTTSYGRSLLTLANTAALQVAVGGASDTVAGLVEFATDAETITGTDAARGVTPHGLTAALNARPPSMGLHYKWNGTTTDTYSDPGTGKILYGDDGLIAISCTDADSHDLSGYIGGLDTLPGTGRGSVTIRGAGGAVWISNVNGSADPGSAAWQQIVTDGTAISNSSNPLTIFANNEDVYVQLAIG